jgi:hypothetical protein
MWRASNRCTFVLTPRSIKKYQLTNDKLFEEVKVVIHNSALAQALLYELDDPIYMVCVYAHGLTRPQHQVGAGATHAPAARSRCGEQRPCPAMVPGALPMPRCTTQGSVHSFIHRPFRRCACAVFSC